MTQGQVNLWKVKADKESLFSKIFVSTLLFFNKKNNTAHIRI